MSGYDDDKYTGAVNTLAEQLVEMVVADAERCEEFDMLKEDYTCEAIRDLNEKVNDLLKKRLS